MPSTVRRRAPAASTGPRPRISAATRGEVGERLLARAAHIGAVVRSADRHDEVELVHAGGDAALGALAVRDQRGDGQAVDRKRARRDFGCVSELRYHLRRHERADLDLAHPGTGFGREPFELGGGRHERRNVLDAVAQSDFAHAHVNARLHRACLRLRQGAGQRPLNAGLRFSLNARTPSRRSSVTTRRL